jgi:hypothetical protein
MTYVRVENSAGHRIDLPAFAIEVLVEDVLDVMEVESMSEPIVSGAPTIGSLLESLDALMETREQGADEVLLVRFGSVSEGVDGRRVWSQVEAVAARSSVLARKEGVNKMRAVKAEFDRLMKPFGIDSFSLSYDVQLDFGELEYHLKDPALVVYVALDPEGRYFNLKGGWWFEVTGQKAAGGDAYVKARIGKVDAKPRELASAAAKYIKKLSSF